MKAQTTVLIFLLFASVLLMPHHSLAVAEDNDAITAEERASLRAIEESYAAEETESSYRISGEAAQNPIIANPICNIEATVTSIETNADNPAYYNTKIDIKNMTVSQAVTESACGGVYRKQIEKTGQIMPASEYQKEAIKAGDDIRAQVEFKDDGTMKGYFLSNVTVTSPAPEPAAPQETEQKNNSMQEKKDSTNTLIGAFSLLTLVILVGMIYAARDKSKKL